ncbi:PTS N-acetylglucosamine transporter subunit IIBC [Mucilaginibacter sp. ZT4R22]|uniref:PTS N-acetylglucosamine transporter subunit IIBC n=1 Tax=Mucilaginibacter pankratovii TaxID=2772110 RepID=A0ABR7WN49_9SPHI|nr:PTS N-acetylglucosamine transporter subunit IIBC [Mucilaginibacter pankratovii]MBD1362732.1 PTS N-acetylglucosamine transporter subunit IIBC [Mucilaginibacter pankratovii]
MSTTEKTRKFLIATHGKLAGGVKSSLDIITGAADNVFLIEAYVDESRSVEDDIKAVIAQLTENDELIAFTDLLGGSITNQILQHASQKNVHVVSGFNLALVIEILLADTDAPAEEVIAEAIENAKQQMVYVNTLLAAQNTEEDHD